MSLGGGVDVDGIPAHSPSSLSVHPFTKPQVQYQLMPLKTRRAPIATRDVDGREIYLIPLAHTDLKARILRDDYHRLMAEGWSPQWMWNCGAVKLNNYRTNLQRVSRLITKPSEGFRVKHSDKDPLNLRSDNLRLVAFKHHKQEPHRAA